MFDKKILCVDDEPTIRYIFNDLLTDGGYDVVQAEDGQKALDLWSPDISLMITDLSMPGMDGFALSKAIREYDPHLPIIMVTASPDPADEARACDYGINCYMVKPPQFSELFSNIERLLN